MKRLQRVINCLTPAAWVGLGVLLLVMAIYLFSAARTMTGFGDSDELITAGFTGSLVHPPGYPLLTSLLFLATHIPYIPVGIGAHGLAAVIMASTMWILYWIVIEAGVKRRDDWTRSLMVGALVIIGATSSLLWLSGIVIEVFGLNALYSLLFLWLTMRLVPPVQKQWDRRQWLIRGVIWGVVGGLGLAHHQTFLLIVVSLVPWLIWWWRKQWRRVGWGWLLLYLGWVVGFGLGYGPIVFIAGHLTDYAWKIEPTWQGFLRFYLRSDYGGYSPETGMMQSWWSGITPMEVLYSWQFYLAEVYRHWGVIAGLGIVGIAFGYKRLGRWFGPLLTGTILAGPVLTGYLAVARDGVGTVEFETARAIVERMYVLSEVWWSIWVILGGLFIWEYGWWWANKWGWKRFGGISVIVFGVITFVWVGARFPTHSLARYKVMELYVQEMLAHLPDGTRIVCMSDVSCFGLTYAQAVLGLRNDVVVISTANQYRSEYIKKQPDLARFNVPDNPNRIGEMVGWATFQGKPIAVAQLNSYWAQALGLNGEAFTLTPLPYLLAIVREPSGIVPSYQPYYDSTQAAADSRADYRYEKVLRAIMAEQHTLSGYVLTRMGEKQLAAGEIGAGLVADPANGMLTAMAQNLATEQVDAAYISPWSREAFSKLRDECGEMNKVVCLIRQAQWLVWRNPNEVYVRNNLALVLEEANLLSFAKREYKHALELEPNSTAARLGLERLRAINDLGDELD